MKKIKIVIVSAGAGDYPGCADLLDSCPELDVIAKPMSLEWETAQAALPKSDVLVVDEPALDQDGYQSLLSLHREFPSITILLVHEKGIENNMMAYFSAGVRGFVERKSIVSQLRKAIPALYSGEVWMPRQLVQSLRRQSTDGVAVGPLPASLLTVLPVSGKLN